MYACLPREYQNEIRATFFAMNPFAGKRGNPQKKRNEVKKRDGLHYITFLMLTFSKRMWPSLFETEKAIIFRPIKYINSCREKRGCYYYMQLQPYFFCYRPTSHTSNFLGAAVILAKTQQVFVNKQNQSQSLSLSFLLLSVILG